MYSSLYAVSNAKVLSNKLHINPASKASIQWERIFSKQRKMKRFGIDKLTQDEKMILKLYLINHSADSDQPEMAGI
jgi:hypothetical protein